MKRCVRCAADCRHWLTDWQLGRTGRQIDVCALCTFAWALRNDVKSFQLGTGETLPGGNRFNFRFPFVISQEIPFRVGSIHGTPLFERSTRNVYGLRNWSFSEFEERCLQRGIQEFLGECFVLVNYGKQTTNQRVFKKKHNWLDETSNLTNTYSTLRKCFTWQRMSWVSDRVKVLYRATLVFLPLQHQHTSPTLPQSLSVIMYLGG